LNRMAEEEPPKPLDYESPSTEPKASGVRLATSLIAGLVVGAALAGIAGLIIGFSASSGTGTGIGVGIVAFAFFGLIVASIVRNRRLGKGRRDGTSRFFILGLLIGCGVTCLLAGLCFAALRKI
jgi:hypothetical protein